MSENEIKENNKLIAKFMGWTVEKNCFSKVEKYGDKLQNERGISVKNRDYHSDWNLLIQVVEKIEQIKDPNNISELFIFEILGDCCRVLVHPQWEIIEENIPNITISTHSKIESVYKCTVEFIKWYNAQSFS